jgi:hypothetical protein
MTERHIASVFRARVAIFDEMVKVVAANPNAADEWLDEGWSAPAWVRLANGDLILGCFPLGPTYEALEVEVELDWDTAQASDSISESTYDYEGDEPTRGTTEAMTTDTTYFAYPGDTVSTEDGFPFVATHWAWQTGDHWMAVAEWEDQGSWCDDTDAETLRERPANWWRLISDVPTSGRLIYRNAEGEEFEVAP